nr:hypothetical protein [Tanacetum cinerariifolium]
MANLEFCDTYNMVAYLQKLKGSEEFHQIVDFLNKSRIRYALIENPTIYVSLILQFWQTARTLDNGEMEITATIDGKVKVVTKASIRRHLKLEDFKCISILPTTDIFEQLAIMGMTLQELTVLCTTLSQKVESFEADLKQTKKVYGAAYTMLIIKVKKLGKTIKTSQARRKAKIVNEEVDLEDPSKQGKSLIEDIDQDAKVTLVTPTQVSTQGEAHSEEDQPEDQLRVISAAMVLTDTTRRNVQTYTKRRAVSTGSGRVSTASRMISIAEELVSTTGASMPVSTAGMVDKGKGIMEESGSDVTKIKRQQEQERLGLQTAAKAKRKKPMTQAQQRTYMSNYIKHMGSYTLKHLKKLSFDEIKELFEATMRSIYDFVPIKSEDDKAVPKLSKARSLKRDAEEELDQGSLRRKRLQGMNVEALQTKYPIIDWEIYTEDTKKYWKIIIVGNHTEMLCAKLLVEGDSEMDREC